jgi:hypothetical protein
LLKSATSINRSLPFRERGIKIDWMLINVTIKILNASPIKTLTCKGPDGFDRRIKDALNTDLRRFLI